MGSAITFPLSDNGNKINLWGTWLDDEIIESSLKGYLTFKLVIPWLIQSSTEKLINDFIEKELPLLSMLRSIIFDRAEPASQLKKLILKLGY